MKRHLLTVAAAMLVACAVPQSPKKSSLAKDAKAGAADAGSEAAPLPPGIEVYEEASLRGSGFATDPQLQPVRFDYDSAQLSDENLEVLKANAAVIKERKDSDFLIAGHCDERGTVAYNLALGQKRAKEVRDYYIRLGVDGRRVATISYGKEEPQCSEATEACWSRNRRAITGVRVKKAAPPAASTAQ